MGRKWLFGAMLALLVLGVSGCGQAAQPAGSIMVTMTDYKFDPSSIKVPEGTVVFYLVNSANSNSHDMNIRDAAGNHIAGSDTVTPGDVSVFTVDNLKPGTYTIYCSQPGHEASGMTGTLTVTPRAGASPGASRTCRARPPARV